MALTCNEIHFGDIGTVFEITLYDDCEVLLPGVELATDMKILFQKPDETVIIQDAVFSTDGTDSKIQYVSVLNDLDQTGNWKIQARITMPTGLWTSSIDKFKVYVNLDA